MKKNTKGFTLIELLAVIVILAIIALIAVPVIMNILTKSRQSAAADTAYSILNSAELYYAEALLDHPTEAFTATVFTFSKDETTGKGVASPTGLELKGTIPTAGSVTVDANGVAHVGEAVLDAEGKVTGYEGTLTVNGLTCSATGNEIKCS